MDKNVKKKSPCKGHSLTVTGGNWNGKRDGTFTGSNIISRRKTELREKMGKYVNYSGY
jgi:hypothetical protein